MRYVTRPVRSPVLDPQSVCLQPSRQPPRDPPALGAVVTGVECGSSTLACSPRPRTPIRMFPLHAAGLSTWVPRPHSTNPAVAGAGSPSGRQLQVSASVFQSERAKRTSTTSPTSTSRDGFGTLFVVGIKMRDSALGKCLATRPKPFLSRSATYEPNPRCATHIAQWRWSGPTVFPPHR
jgi:hypothetical protein